MKCPQCNQLMLSRECEGCLYRGLHYWQDQYTRILARHHIAQGKLLPKLEHIQHLLSHVKGHENHIIEILQK